MTRRQGIGMAAGVCLVAFLLLALLLGRELSAPALPPLAEFPEPADNDTLARGAVLARAGNCMACHTARGGEPYAGGHAIRTPFGTLVAGNLTPDVETGLGGWSPEAFRRALHQGISRDGRLLYPAFPYGHTTRLQDADVDALYAHLRSLPPVSRPSEPHALRFPYNTQMALALWRLLNFEPARLPEDATRSADWNRGAYLVQGVAHCAACHSPRNAWGGSGQAFSGGLMPDGRWYAPSLLDPAEAGVQDWPVGDVLRLLRDGHLDHATTMGPMAEVVFHGTSHLPEADLLAMATYLRELPVPAVRQPAFKAADAGALRLGAQVYERHCAECHGPQGQGAPGAYLPLAGNRALLMVSPVNAIQAILSGGFSPATAGNPQPYGMPPYRTQLSDTEVAAVASFIRQSWGNRAGPVSPLDVQRVR
ncbi:c-type cytochrome [Hydrogenophaga sp.]|uniref:c-type cytochrome n=1 Tax=Hydrogenophaga sp. TaxID=1904254 RepID=UPI002C92B8C9|nr:c-type cytochrome [Hydrogenophaga sp.]HMP10884.1 c-type cytochrome [Hydrogenophaga sp.]